jgi:hypothetical protein
MDRLIASDYIKNKYGQKRVFTLSILVEINDLVDIYQVA